MNKKPTLSYKLVNFCEFDKYASKAYCAIHGVDERLNLGDITKVDEKSLEEYTMVCGGSPCQDFSLAGKQGGSVWTCEECKHEYNPLMVHFSERDKCPVCGCDRISKTRSSLLVEYLRIIRATNPKFGIYENVKNIVSKKFQDTFFTFVHELEEYNYNTYWQVMNSKDYGIPQNRERLFLIFIRKDVDNGLFKFPEPFGCDLVMRDILEDKVDPKYYVENERTKSLIQELKENGKLEKEISNAVRGGGRGSLDRHQWDMIAVQE